MNESKLTTALMAIAENAGCQASILDGLANLSRAVDQGEVPESELVKALEDHSAPL